MKLSGERQTWMDLLRGVAVLLVVVNHAGTTFSDTDLQAPAAVLALNEVLTPFRIPMLVFLSGLLLSGSLRKGPRPYFQGKLSNIAWPYLLWLVPHSLLVKSDPDPLLVLLGDSQLWFLLFLGFYYVLAFALQKIPPAWVVAGALLLSLLAPGGEKYGERLWFLFACFMAGHWATRHPQVWPRLADRRVPVLVAVVVLVGYLATARTFAFGPETAVGSLAGIIVLSCIARRIASSRATAPLRAAGRDSLVVYVAHSVGMQLVLPVVAVLGWGSPALVFALFLLAGVAFPALLIALKRRWWPAGYLFTLTPRPADPNRLGDPGTTRPPLSEADARR